ncbi:MAG: zf-HC2 domain-containing protein [Pyrinomonadaceae bacterium]
MRKHLTDSELERYRERTLPPQALLAANAHLYDCEACHGRYGGDANLEAAFAFLQNIGEPVEEESHLPFEQLAAYVDDALEGEERRAVATHLEQCAVCAAEVRELRPLRDLITPAPALAPPKIATPAHVNGPTLFEKLRAAWRAPGYRIPALIAGAVLLVVLSGWFLIRSPRTAEVGPQAQVPPTPQEHAQDKQVTENVSPGGNAPADKSGSPVEKASNDKNTAPPSSVMDADVRVTVDAGGRVEGLDALAPAHRQLVGRMLTTARVETPRMSWESRPGRDVLMGGADGRLSFSLLSPVGQIVRDVRPTLRWTPLEGAESYVVTVRDSRGGTVAMSGPLSSAEWSVPQPLRRGVVYSWKVLAVKDGEEIVSPSPTAADARFKVLEETRAEELDSAERLRPRSRLLLGALYARAGLLDEAEREFQKLSEENPRSRVARELLRDVKSRRR